MNNLNCTSNEISKKDTNIIDSEKMSEEEQIVKTEELNKQVTLNTESNKTKDDSDSEEPKKGIVGLNNMGNTCYLNSVIQVLSNMDEFRQYLFEGNFVGSLKSELDNSLFYQTYRIIKHLWETTADNLSPKSFRNKFVQKQNQFMGFEQQDSHEAMQFLLDNLHEEVAQPIDLNISVPDEMKPFFDKCEEFYNSDMKNKNTLKEIDDNPDKALDYFAMKYYSKLAKNYSEVSELFQSIVCNLTKCSDCSHLSYSFDNSFMLSVSLPELDEALIKESEVYKKFFDEKVEELKEKTTDQDLISKFCINELKNKYIFKLSELLDSFQKAEILDEKNQWYCDNCEKKVCAYRQSKIYKNPKFVIIHLKRFKHVNHNGNTFIVKLKNLVGYEEQINIRHLMIKDSPNTTYELIGGINHMGEYNFGHFTAFAKNNNKWYNYNDDRVNEIKCTDVPISPSAYMLIYRLKESE